MNINTAEAAIVNNSEKTVVEKKEVIVEKKEVVVEKQKNENEVLTKTSYGQFLVLRNDYIGRFFVKGIHYETSIVAAMLKNIMPGDTVIDVGANIGVHTIPYAQAVGKTGKVFSFEPQIVINRLLTENVKMNGLENQVQILRKAVGHTNCQTTLNATLDRVSLNYKSKSANFGGLNLGPAGEAVEMITLDSMRDQFPNGVKYIKMDVEGAERLVILGAKQLITEFRPYVLFEQNSKTITKEMIKMFNLDNDVVKFNIIDFFLKDLKYKQIVKYEANFYAIPE